MTRAQLVRLLREYRLAVVSTVGPDGAPQSAWSAARSATTWRSCSTRWTAPARPATCAATPRISVVIGWDREATAQIEGLADFPDGRGAGADPRRLLPGLPRRARPPGLAGHHPRPRPPAVGPLQRLRAAAGVRLRIRGRPPRMSAVTTGRSAIWCASGSRSFRGSCCSWPSRVRPVAAHVRRHGAAAVGGARGRHPAARVPVRLADRHDRQRRRLLLDGRPAREVRAHARRRGAADHAAAGRLPGAGVRALFVAACGGPAIGPARRWRCWRRW